MSQEFNPDVLASISILNSHGYQAYLVGGAVRDYFLNCESSDYDVTTNAKLEEICNVFNDYKTKVYANKQCVGVKISDSYIEISSFKGNSIEEDLFNRDFSINSIAYNPKLGFVDPYNGILDIKNKLLRTVNDSIKVIKKDPIRILRAIRFQILYNLKIDDELEKNIFELKELLNLVHPMKIQNEINPILLSNECAIYINKYKDIFKNI